MKWSVRDESYTVKWVVSCLDICVEEITLLRACKADIYKAAKLWMNLKKAI